MSNSVGDTLLGGQSVTATVQGGSMKPMLKPNKSRVVISPVCRELKKRDVVLFPSGEERKYILHRIVKIEGDYCVTRGDNSAHCERVKKDEIIGVLAAFNRSGKWVEVTSRRYLFYVSTRRAVYPFLSLAAKIKRVLKRRK